MTRVKICGLCGLEDARWAWKCGADLLGFIFVPASPRYVEPDAAQRIADSLRSEGCRAEFVGVFVNETLKSVQAVANQCSLDHVQLSGDESINYVRDLGLSAIVARRVRRVVPWAELSAYPAWAYLLDTDVTGRHGGTGLAWSWSYLPGHTSKPVILAGGLTPETVSSAVRTAMPWGVDVASGVESSPGRKDPQKVQAFMDRVREEDHHAEA